MRNEAELAALQKELGEPDFYRRPSEEIAAAMKRIETLPRRIEQAYERWAELDEA